MFSSTTMVTTSSTALASCFAARRASQPRSAPSGLCAPTPRRQGDAKEEKGEGEAPRAFKSDNRLCITEACEASLNCDAVCEMNSEVCNE